MSTDSITFWENKRSIPQIQFRKSIIEFLGYNPYRFEVKTFGDKIRHYRNINGLSQRRLGKVLGVDPSTVAAWEEKRSLPQNKAKKKFLILIGSAI